MALQLQTMARPSIVLCFSITLLVQYLFLTNLTGSTSANLNLDEQAKVSVLLDTTENFLQNAKDKIIFGQSNSVDPTEKAKLLKHITTAIGTVSTLMTAANAFGTIFQIVAEFTNLSELEAIQEHFNQVNKTLEDINFKLNNFTEEFKFNSWLTNYIEWEHYISKGDEMLTAVIVTDEKEKKEVNESYRDYFERNNIEANVYEIYNLAVLDSNATSKNLFEIFVTENGCDIIQISKLMVIIQNIMTSAAKQSAVYQFFKNGKVNDIQEIITSYYDKMYDIRRKFDIQVWYCYRDFKTSAEKLVVDTIINANNQSDKEDLSRLIHETLTDKISWYDWAVGFYEEDTPILVDKECVAYEKREQYMTVNSGDNNIILVWQDVNDVSYGCNDIISAYTFVKYTPCSGCDNNVITSADDIIIDRDCYYHYETNFIDKCYGGTLSTCKNYTFSFITAAFRNFQDPCLSINACNNNGICKHIPYSTNYVCICSDYYEGENCETFNSKTANSKMTNMMTSLRQGYVTFSGVAPVIDVNLNNAIQNLRNVMQMADKLKQILFFYANDFNEAEYIVQTYEIYRLGEISGDVFSQRLAPRDLHVDFEGFFVTYKKQLAADLDFEKICTEDYSTLVTKMKLNLLTIDKALTEAKLWNIERKLQNLSKPVQEQNIILYAQSIVDTYLRRQKEYEDSWIKESCGKLNVPDLQQNFCDNYHSYDGLQLTLNCSSQKTPSPNSITCSRSEDGSLAWSAIPECQYQPSNWSSWSDCSSSCGNGTITRQRTWPDKRDDSEHGTCNNYCCTDPATEDEIAVDTVVDAPASTYCPGDKIICTHNDFIDYVRLWPKLSSSDWNGNSYGFIKVFEDKKQKWCDARKACHAMGADLVAPDSEADFKKLEAYIMTNRKYDGYWTSATNRTGDWKYAANNRWLPDGEDDWWVGQPDIDHHTAGEPACAYLFKHERKYKLKASGCDDELYFICEVKETLT